MWASLSFFLYHRKCFQLFIVEYGVSYGLSHTVFSMLRYIPCIPTLLRVCVLKECWVFSKAFLHLLRWSYAFYFSIHLCGDSHWLICTPFVFLGNLPSMHWKSIISLPPPVSWNVCFVHCLYLFNTWVD